MTPAKGFIKYFIQKSYFTAVLVDSKYNTMLTTNQYKHDNQFNTGMIKLRINSTGQ